MMMRVPLRRRNAIVCLHLRYMQKKGEHGRKSDMYMGETNREREGKACHGRAQTMKCLKIAIIICIMSTFICRINEKRRRTDIFRKRK